jgi:hypothetical protein
MRPAGVQLISAPAVAMARPVAVDVAPRAPGVFRSLKVALVSDALTRACLGEECRVRDLTPLNYWVTLRLWRPDLVFVESAWQGWRNAWKYKVAAYPDHPDRSNARLQDLVVCAKDLGIPVVFWNKEDGVHFERFVASARLFDHVFTVDENCLPRYRAVMGPCASVHSLPFPVQPRHHHFTGFNFRHRRVNFVGSYSQHMHDRRRLWQDDVFDAACRAGLGLTVFDRNSDRKAAHYRYPSLPGLEVMAAVPHDQTARIYKDYLISLNVNTVADSATMYSRRLVEILACGGLAVTAPARSVETMFKEYCWVVSDRTQAQDLFARFAHGPQPADLERARAGADYVAREHTWSRRLEEIIRVVGL